VLPAILSVQIHPQRPLGVFAHANYAVLKKELTFKVYMPKFTRLGTCSPGGARPGPGDPWEGIDLQDGFSSLHSDLLLFGCCDRTNFYVSISLSTFDKGLFIRPHVELGSPDEPTITFSTLYSTKNP